MKLKISSFLNLIFILFSNHQLQLHSQFSDSNTSTKTAGTSKRLPPNGACRLTFTQFIIFSNHFVNISSLQRFQILSLLTTMYRNPSPNSTNSDVFYVEQLSPETGPIRNNTPVILNSKQFSEAMDPETITISSVASPEPQLVTLDSDSNEPTFPYAFGAQHPIVPPSLNDLHLPPNPFNVLATMAVIQQDQEQSPQSPEPSDLSPISTPPMNVSTIDDGDTTHRYTDDNTFYSSDNDSRRTYWDLSADETFESNEPRRVYPTGSPPSTPPPLPRRKRRLTIGMSFPKKGGVSQHTCEACGQPLPQTKTS